MAAAERGEADSGGSGIRGLAGRWPDADVLLQGGMSEGLRDWDLWGPLIFCLLLSLFLSRGAKDSQKDLVFSGIFAMVWIGEAVVTLQIKLLGGNMYVDTTTTTTGCLAQDVLTRTQSLFPVHLHHRIHAVPTRHCRAAQCRGHPHDCPDPRVPGADCVVVGSRRQHHGWVGRGEEPGGDCSVSAACLLHCAGLYLFHQLGGLAWCVCVDSDLDIRRVGRVRRVRDAPSGNEMIVLLLCYPPFVALCRQSTIGCVCDERLGSPAHPPCPFPLSLLVIGRAHQRERLGRAHWPKRGSDCASVRVCQCWTIGLLDSSRLQPRRPRRPSPTCLARLLPVSAARPSHPHCILLLRLSLPRQTP
jgi:hypothetical protein